MPLCLITVFKQINKLNLSTFKHPPPYHPIQPRAFIFRSFCLNQEGHLISFQVGTEHDACVNAEIWIFLKFWVCVCPVQFFSPSLSAFPQHRWFSSGNHVFPECVSVCPEESLCRFYLNLIKCGHDGVCAEVVCVDFMFIRVFLMYFLLMFFYALDLCAMLSCPPCLRPNSTPF